MNWRSCSLLDADARVRTGDILAFSGHGIVSETVKLVTGSHVSHIGIVLEPGPCAQIIESTSLRGFTGVSIGGLVERCGEYDGAVWWLPLRDVHSVAVRHDALQQWLRDRNLRHYDTWGAVGAALRVHLGSATAEFCSELAAEFLQFARVLPASIDPSLVRPCDLVRMPIFQDNYYQLAGQSETI